MSGPWRTGLIAAREALQGERFAELTGSRPDFDESFRHYREQMVHALLMWTITLCHSPLLPNMQPEETTLTMIERITTAMADLDSIDNL